MVHEHPKMKKAVSDITNAIQLLTTAMSQQEEKRQLKKSKKSKREKAASISGGRKVSAQSIIPDVEVDRNGIPALGHDGNDEDNGSIPNVMDDVQTNSRADWIKSNPCYFCWCIGHSARDHNVTSPWPEHLSERWKANRGAWHVVKSMVESGRSIIQVASILDVSLEGWKACSDFELLIDVAEASTGLTRMIDKTPVSVPPRSKPHKWPGKARPVVRTRGPASTETDLTTIVTRNKAVVEVEHNVKQNRKEALSAGRDSVFTFSATSTASPSKLKKRNKRKLLGNNSPQGPPAAGTPEATKKTDKKEWVVAAGTASSSMAKNESIRLSAVELGLKNVERKVDFLVEDRNKNEVMMRMLLDKHNIPGDVIDAKLKALKEKEQKLLPVSESRLLQLSPTPVGVARDLIGPLATAAVSPNTSGKVWSEQAPIGQWNKKHLIDKIREYKCDDRVMEDVIGMRKKAQLVKALSWLTPEGLYIVILDERHVTRPARVVAFADKELVWCCDPLLLQNLQVDVVAPLEDLPPRPMGACWTPTLSDVYVDKQAAEAVVTALNSSKRLKSSMDCVQGPTDGSNIPGDGVSCESSPVPSASSDVTVSPDLSVSEADGIPPVDGSVPVPIAGSCEIEVEI